MADENATPEASQQPPQDAKAEPPRSKRAAPTIDLTATEMPPKAATDEKPAPQSDAAAPRGSSMARLGAGIGIGAALVVALMFGLWRGGYLPIGAADDRELKEKVATLEKQVSELQNRPQARPDTSAVDALTKRVDAIEAALKNLPPADTSVADKLTAADNAMKSLGTALAALSHRTDDAVGTAAAARAAADAATAAVADLKASMQAAAASNANRVPRADIEALTKRVAALETQTEAAHEALTKSSGNDIAARLALGAEVLRSAVAVGAPYADELADVHALGGDDKALAPLDQFAASGAPTAQALTHELSALLPLMLKIAGAPVPSADFLARLEANASKLVRIRPLKAPQGDEPSAVLARLDADAANADIAAALTDLAKLPDKVRAPAEVWIAKAKARQAALAAATQYAKITARALRPQ